MSYIHNISYRRQAKNQTTNMDLQKWSAYPYVDTLYDHTQFLSQTQPIAEIPGDPGSGDQIAVVGAGAAGMVAAYELMRAGIQPKVFEATDRIGGRTWSENFETLNSDAPPIWAEMGAMRVPVSQKLFWYYALFLIRVLFPHCFPMRISYINGSSRMPIHPSFLRDHSKILKLPLIDLSLRLLPKF
jgi:hypothetical protein